MSWRVAGQEDLIALRSCLVREEWRCVAFTSRLRERFTSRWSSGEFYSLLINGDSETGVSEAIMLAQDGCVVPVLGRSGGLNLGRSIRFRHLLLRYRPKLHSVMGDRRSVLKFENLLDEPPTTSVDYHLMVRHFDKAPPSYPLRRTDIEIRAAGEEDMSRLYPLQKAYELEEVFLDPARFDERRCRALLRKNLKKQLVVLAERNGIPIAKAGTNARGYRIDQLGGVYTQAELRNRGIGTQMMRVLLCMIGETKGGVSLFVKMDNRAALRLYQKCRFEVKDGFRISYYPCIRGLPGKRINNDSQR